jgi:protein-S-isoprenylcysteine O-methyltransferase Ste14
MNTEQLKKDLLKPSNFLVLSQFVCIFLLFWIGPTFSNKDLPFMIQVIGMIIIFLTIRAFQHGKFSIFPRPKPNAPLLTHGPFFYVRHPMYLGLLLFTLGIVMNPISMWKILIYGLLVLIVLMKIHLEERSARKQWPAYESYALNTKKLIPYIW